MCDKSFQNRDLNKCYFYKIYCELPVFNVNKKNNKKKIYVAIKICFLGKHIYFYLLP